MDSHEERLNCKVCWLPYNLGNRKPHVLNCGHSACAACIVLIVRQTKKPWVPCRLCYSSTTFDFFRNWFGVPINHALVEFLKYMQTEKLRTEGIVALDPTNSEEQLPMPGPEVPPLICRPPFFQPIHPVEVNPRPMAHFARSEEYHLLGGLDIEGLHRLAINGDVHLWCRRTTDPLVQQIEVRRDNNPPQRHEQPDLPQDPHHP